MPQEKQSLKKNLKDIVRNGDLYGEQVGLSFKDKGQTFNTFYGGCLSWIANALFFVFVVHTFWQMFMLQATTITSIKQYGDIDAQPLLEYRKAGFMMYTIIRQHGSKKDLTITEMGKYIQVAVTKVDKALLADFDDKSVDKDHILPIKKCELSDLLKFADKKYAHMYWKEIQNIKGLALCPDFDNPSYENAGWKNHLGKSTYKYIETTVAKCMNRQSIGISGKNCASPTLINQFVKKLIVENYVIQAHIDSQKFDGKPLYYSNDLLKKTIFSSLSQDNCENTDADLVQNSVKTQDMFIQMFGTLSWDFNYYQVQNVKNHVVFSPKHIPGCLHQFKVLRIEIMESHTRVIMGLLTVLGIVGGAQQILLSLAQIFLGSYNERAYSLKLITNLYDVLPKVENSRNIGIINRDDQWKVSILELIPPLRLFASKELLKKREKVNKMQEIGEEKATEEMNLIQVIRDIRDLKYAVKHKLMDNLSYDDFVASNPESIIKLEESDETETYTGRNVVAVAPSNFDELEQISQEKEVEIEIDPSIPQVSYVTRTTKSKN